MANINQIERFAGEAVRTRDFVIAAARRSVRMGVMPGVAAMTAVAGSSLLYLMGYQDGSSSIVGLATAAAIAPFVLTVAMGMAVGSPARHIARICRQVWTQCGNASMGLVVISLALIAINHLAGIAMGPLLVDEVRMIALNEYSHWYKPIGHVSGMVAMFVALTPGMLVALPAALRSRCDLDTAFWATRDAAHNRMYSMWKVHRLMVVLVLMAQVPYVGLIVLPLITALSMVMFERLFRSA